MSTNSPPVNLSNERVLFLFNKLTGVAPYTHEFVPDESDPHLLASFISAMSNFMEEVLGYQEPHWRTDYGSDVTLLVEVGEWVVGCLAVSRETNEARSKLRRIIKEFEESFSALRHDDSFEGGIFEEFDKFVLRTFLGGRLTENTRVWKVPDWSDRIRKYNLPSDSFKIKKFLYSIEDGSTIRTISEMSSLSYDLCMNYLTQSVWNGAVLLQYIPSLDDILSVSVGSTTSILSKQNPLNLSVGTMLVVSSLNGRHPIKKYMDLIEPDGLDTTLIELGLLTSQGYLQKISLEKSLLLMNWCILKRLVNLCLLHIDTSVFEELLHEIMKESIMDHPLLGHVRFLSEGTITIDLDPLMTPSDLDQMYDDIEFLIQQISTAIEGHSWLEDSLVRRLRKQLIRKSYNLMEFRNECTQLWMNYLEDTSF